MMQKFKQFQLALAQFKGYPLWPVRIIKALKDTKGQTNYLVFAYGDHSECRISELHLLPYEENIGEAGQRTEKNVKSAFNEVNQFPDVYKSASKAYLALSSSERESALPQTSSELLDRIVSNENEVEKTRKEMMETITKKVQEKCGDNSKNLKLSVESIVSEIYDSVSLEFNPKFERILESYKGLKLQLENLENRIAVLENKLDDYDQEKLLDTLVFHGVQQKPGSDLKSTMLHVLSEKMNVTGLTERDITSAYRTSLKKHTSNNDTITTTLAPVFLKFSNTDAARKVFKNKAKLAGSRMFVSEALTKRRRDILNVARDKFGVRNVWSDRGQILAKLPNEPILRKIRTLADCV